MPISLVRQAIWDNTVQGANGGTTLPVDTTGADLLVLAMTSYYAYGVITDSKGNSWNLAVVTGNGGSGAMALWYAKSPVVGANHTFTITGNGTYSSNILHAFSGTDQTSPLDVYSGAVGDRAGVITPSVSGCVVVGASGTFGTPVPDSSLTSYVNFQAQGGNTYARGMGYVIQTTPQAINTVWSNTSATVAAAFKPAPAAAAPTLGVVTVASNSFTRTGFQPRYSLTF